MNNCHHLTSVWVLFDRVVCSCVCVCFAARVIHIALRRLGAFALRIIIAYVPRVALILVNWFDSVCAFVRLAECVMAANARHAHQTICHVLLVVRLRFVSGVGYDCDGFYVSLKFSIVFGLVTVIHFCSEKMFVFSIYVCLNLRPEKQI